MAIIDLSTLVLLVVTLLTGTIGLFAWRQRPSPGSTTLAVLLWSMAVWTAFVIVAVMADGYALSRIGVNVVLTATGATTVAFLAFALEYTGHERYLRWPYWPLFVAEPLAVAALTFTAEYHDLFWTSIYRSSDHYSGWVHEAGIGQTLHISLTYAIAVVGIYLLLRKLLRARAAHRTQTAAVFVAAIAPLVGNALYVLDVFVLAQVIGFAVSGVVLYWAVTRGRLVDLTPIARDTTLEELQIGVAVVDDSGNITDVNPRALALLEADDQDAIGKPPVDGLGKVGEIVHSEADERTVAVEIDGQPRQLRVEQSGLTDSLDRTVGQLLLVEDVTERERRRREIEAQNDRLEEFATMVSHDLRNPLDVASGHVELMRADRTPAADRPGTYLETDRLDETARALERIETIVEDVLTLAREGEDVTDPDAVSLRSAARSAWEHVDTADARLVVGTDDRIVADRGHLERLFENLFRNAVEHGETTTTVSIGLLRDGSDRLGFYVADDGVGIPDGIRDELFESGVTGTADGTGFGLAIVDQLAELHDWTVEVATSDEGGARFEFTDVEFSTEALPSAESL